MDTKTAQAIQRLTDDIPWVVIKRPSDDDENGTIA